MVSVIDVLIKDPYTNETVRVGEEGVLNTVIHPHPPKNEDLTALPFRQYFTNDGTSAGSNDMLVDGSTTNAEFWVGSDADNDIYIKLVSIVIADASATLNKFGNITALTNGVEFSWENGNSGTVVIADALKTNFDFIRLAGGQPAFGDAAGAFLANNVSGTSEAYIPTIDLSYTFGLPWGIRIRKGSTDKLKFVIKDDINTGTVPDEFDAIAYGIKF